MGKCVVDSQGKRNIGDCKATVDEKGDYVLSTGQIIEGTKGSSMQLLITQIFANPNKITYSNASISMQISNFGF